MKQKRTVIQWAAGTIGILILLVIIAGQRVSSPSWELETMGTLCHITISGSVPQSGLNRVQKKITEALENVDTSMSTWNPDSEISGFNQFKGLEPFAVSPEFASVVRRAGAISKKNRRSV